MNRQDRRNALETQSENLRIFADYLVQNIAERLAIGEVCYMEIQRLAGVLNTLRLLYRSLDLSEDSEPDKPEDRLKDILS